MPIHTVPGSRGQALSQQAGPRGEAGRLVPAQSSGNPHLPDPPGAEPR